MTFKEFLIKYDIPFQEDGDLIDVDCNDIVLYEMEFRKELPNAELSWDYFRYKAEPRRSGD